MTKLCILGWKSIGFRCPDHEVRLTKNDNAAVHRISLIQMPNGTGKTTTLTLLRNALSGKMDQWVPTLKELAGKNSLAGIFVVNLMMDDRRLTIELRLDFIEETIRYRTTFGATVIHDNSP